MNEKKILIFEDEWTTIRGSFELANIFAFEGQLRFIQKARSQDVVFTSWRDCYDAVFIDITLAKNTVWDGFNIIQQIKAQDIIDLNKVVILTGNSKVEEKLQEMGFDTNVVNVLYKPVAFNVLAELLKKILG